MNIIDSFYEISESLRIHKTRTALAVLTVAWGIFMLVLLLGAGRGLQNGVEYQFRDDALNRIEVRGGKTSIDYKGLPRGRYVNYDNADFDQVRSEVDHVDKLNAKYWVGGDNTVRYGNQKGSFNIVGVHADNKYLAKNIITAGRYLNNNDMAENRKVCIIGALVAKQLFDTNPIGETISAGGVSYRVVGVFSDAGSRNEEESVYIPITTAQLVYAAAGRVHRIAYTVGDATYQQSKKSEQQIREMLAKRHNFSPEDKRAARIYNNLDEYKKITDLFYWIRVFVAVVGVGTVLTGVLAVSNIMVISVAERKREIGIRKAIGATPASITRLIVLESVIVTAVAGYLGLLASIGLLELLKAVVPENEYMYQPDVNTFVVVAVTLLVIISGTLAGYLPARRAASIDPVQALQPS